MIMCIVHMHIHTYTYGCVYMHTYIYVYICCTYTDAARIHSLDENDDLLEAYKVWLGKKKEELLARKRRMTVYSHDDEDIEGFDLTFEAFLADQPTKREAYESDFTDEDERAGV